MLGLAFRMGIPCDRGIFQEGGHIQVNFVKYYPGKQNGLNTGKQKKQNNNGEFDPGSG